MLKYLKSVTNVYFEKVQIPSKYVAISIWDILTQATHLKVPKFIERSFVDDCTIFA